MSERVCCAKHWIDVKLRLYGACQSRAIDFYVSRKKKYVGVKRAICVCVIKC